MDVITFFCGLLPEPAEILLPGRQPDNVGEPRFGGGGAEPRVDVEAVGGERVDPPAGAKRGA